MVFVNIIFMKLKNFPIKKYNRNNNNIIISFLIKYWKYIASILIYILRNIFSLIGLKLNEWISYKKEHISLSEAKENFFQAQLVFEIYNFYFPLYYIAFIKKYFEGCIYKGNCYLELEQQLTINIISENVVILIDFIKNLIYLQKRKNKLFEKFMVKGDENNYSSKISYHTRKHFIDNVDGDLSLNNNTIFSYYLRTFLCFGYIIQFGICSPICFVLELFICLFTRAALGLSLKEIYYSMTIKRSPPGLSVLIKFQKLFAYISIISNLCILFYTNENILRNISTGKKLFLIIIVENVILIITKVFSNEDNQPKWFKYREQIFIKYIMSYGKKLKNENKIK